MTRYALVIGIQKYGGLGFGDLKKPVEDAEAIAQILEAHGDFVEVTRLPSRWNEEKQRYEMTAARLTGVNLEQAIIDFFEKVGSHEALIYFSGHGFQVTKLGRKKSYLVTSDCATDTVATAGIALEDLNRLILDAAFSSLVVLLDCCHSGSLLEQSQIQTALGAFQAGNRNRFLATACRSHEKAYEGTEYSLFTGAVLKALQSPGGDGRVRTPKLNQVIADELTGSGQEPVFLHSGGQITLVTYAATGKVEVDESDKLQTALEQLRPDYNILDAPFFEDIATKVANKQARTQILKLRAANWSMLFQKNYVERDQQREAFKQTLLLSQKHGISLLLIRGEPGAGKTALLRWLAYELFCQGKRVFHKKSQSQVGWLEQLREFSEESGGVHFYVIADDLFRDESILEELQQNEVLFPLTLIGTTRQNEDRHIELQGAGYETGCLDLAKPSAAEKERVLSLPEVQSHLAGKSAAERQQLMDSPIMLVLMLQLSEGKPFDLLLWDVIKDLPNTNRQPLYQVFGVLCSFFQHDIIVPFDILRFCLPASNWSERLILEGLAGLIDTATYGGYEGLTTVHQLIAETVMKLDYRPYRQQNQPYVWTDHPPLLKQCLEKIVPNIDAKSETQRRWLCNSLRLLAVYDKADLVRQILQDHSQKIEAIQERNDVLDWSNWIRLYELLGCFHEKQRCVDLQLLTKPKNSSEWGLWLSLVRKKGNHEELELAINHALSWLDTYPDDYNVRIKWLALIERSGTCDQQQEAVSRTLYWLSNYPLNWKIWMRLLVRVERLGTREQQRAAIIQLTSQLNGYTNAQKVWGKYSVLLAKIKADREWIEVVIQQWWQWIIQQQELDKKSWCDFLTVLKKHNVQSLYQAAIHLAVKQHPYDQEIACQIFDDFLDDIDYNICRNLAFTISRFSLPVKEPYTYIHAADFFRDHNEIAIARTMYCTAISTAEEKVKRFSYLKRTINSASLGYAHLLLLTNPPQPDQALEKISPILAQNPKHGVAHLLAAKSYQAKGEVSYNQAINHFEKAIQFDLKKSGFFYYQFGCFYRYAVDDITDARHCFEQSLAQKLNFPACLELAELEAADGNLKRAKTLLQDGLALTPINRPEKEEREKKGERITALRFLLSVPESRD